MRCGIVGLGTHSLEAGRGHRPTIAHVPRGTVHRLPLEKAWFEKVPTGVAFSDALAAVRRWLWCEWVFPQAGGDSGLEKLPGSLREVLLAALASAA
jgi:hypothetical protein